MNQLTTGKFISQKRKEKNLTQEQLAEKLGVSNKTISKWETEEKSVRAYDDEQIMDLLRRTQELEKQKNLLYGILLIVMGIALQALSHTFGGSNVKDFFSGLLLGVSIAEMLVGVYVLGRSIAER